MPKFMLKQLRRSAFFSAAAVGMFLTEDLFAAGAPASPGKPRPNILLILADDLGAYDLSVEGSAFYESPNIDRLARGGMRFTRAYAASSVCSPSRASIMLGKTPARHKITNILYAHSGRPYSDRRSQPGPVAAVRYHPGYMGKWKRTDTKLIPPASLDSLPAADTTLAEALREGGYRTFFAGKWHLGKKGSWPEDHGFDINIGGWETWGPRAYFSPYYNPAMKDGKPGESLPARLANETARFIRDHHAAHPEQPFFAYLSFYSVHMPLQTTREKWQKYQKKAAAMKKPGHRFKVDRLMPFRQVQDNPIYAGMIEAMDDAIGVVLNQLKESGLEEDTIIFFTSDNGGCSSSFTGATSNLPLRGGKASQWEGGIREPWYVKVPGVTKEGTVCATPIIHMDIYPTLLELAGLPLRPKQHCDGVSIVPLLTGGTIAGRDLFWHYPHYVNQGGEPSSIILSGSMKLIHYWEDGRDELYDLAADPGEQTDLASRKPAVAKELRKRLNDWLLETEASLPVLNPLYDGAEEAKALRHGRITLLNQLERESAWILNSKYKPNPTWWGSEPKAAR